MDDVTKKFFEVLDKVGISGASLCKEIPDLTKQKLSNARNGRNSIQIDVVSYVCSHYNNINPGYILTGRGSMFQANHSKGLQKCNPFFLIISRLCNYQ